MSDARLTTEAQWDSYWESAQLPVEVTRGAQSSTDAILDVMDRFVSSRTPLSMLELGGAPGGYLVYFWRRFSHRVRALDNSPYRIEMTRRNFEMLGAQGEVGLGDLVDSPDATFDVVYSLGLIEHFEDTGAVVAAHVRYVKPRGDVDHRVPELQRSQPRAAAQALSIDARVAQPRCYGHPSVDPV